MTPADIGRAAILVVAPDVLRELLQLPKDCYIDAVWTPFDHPGVLHLRVRGAGWPAKEGCLIPFARGTISTDEDGTRVVQWGLPDA